MHMYRKAMFWLVAVIVALWVVACAPAPQQTAETPAPTTADQDIAPAVGDTELATIEIEAKNQVTLKAKGQMISFTEKRKFATKAEEIDLNIPAPTSDKYTYSMELKQAGENEIVVITATAKDARLKSYSALVSVYQVDNQPTALIVICENQQAGTPPVIPTRGQDRPTCGQGSVEI